MAAIQLFALVVLSLIQRPQMVGDGFNEETRVRMQQREEMLRWHMTRLLKEVEELEKKTQGQTSSQLGTQEQSTWGARLLFAVLQYCRFSVLGAVLIVLFILRWWLKKRTSEPDATRNARFQRRKWKLVILLFFIWWWLKKRTARLLNARREGPQRPRARR